MMLPLIIWWGGQTARECEGEKAVKLFCERPFFFLSSSILCENVGISYTPHSTTTIRQEDAAKELDISMSAYCRYEYGKREPTASVLWRMADFYDVTIDYLVGRSDA